MENLYDSKKFWIIWLSCLDSARSIKEIHQIWDYSEGSKALYQPAGTGHEKSIAEEMIDKGYLELEDTEKRRGTTAKMLKSKTEWYSNYIQDSALDVVENKYEDELEESWQAFQSTLEDPAFRGHAFDIEAFKEIIGSRRPDKEDNLVLFVLFLYVLNMHIAYKFIDDNMPVEPKMVFEQGILGLTEMSMTNNNFPVSDYMSMLIENHGTEQVLNSIPSEALETTIYSAMEENFEEQMTEMQNLFGS